MSDENKDVNENEKIPGWFLWAFLGGWFAVLLFIVGLAVWSRNYG
jgi:hypothetical protein